MRSRWSAVWVAIWAGIHAPTAGAADRGIVAPAAAREAAVARASTAAAAAAAGSARAVAVVCRAVNGAAGATRRCADGPGSTGHDRRRGQRRGRGGEPATAAATALTYGSWIEHHCRHCSCSIHDPYVSAVAEDLLVNIHESGSYSPRTTTLPQVILLPPCS